MKTSTSGLYNKAKDNEKLNSAASATGDAFKRAGTFTKETGSKMKEKLDDAGVTDAAVNLGSKIKAGGMFVGGFLYEKASAAGSKINEKIDNNEKLHNAKDVTKEKFGVAAKAVGSGWNSLVSKISGKKEEEPK